jgi:lysophospholipase L1-like esterase
MWRGPGRPRTMRWRPAVLVLLFGAVLALLLPLGVPLPWTDTAATTSDTDIYVAIGDSYSAGLRPADGGGTTTTRDAFPFRIAERATAAGRPVQLLNFACSGTTSAEVLHHRGCPDWARALGAPKYKDPQADAAVAALREHASRVRLVTVVIGGNDVNTCFPENHDAFTPAAQECLRHIIPALDSNLRSLLGRIRSVVGPDVPVVGLTYPDIFLGGYVFGDEPSRSFADASVAMFRDQLNPTLKAAYAASGASFVDLTEITGGYGPLDRSVDLPPYGTIPEPVARVCELTFYCTRKDFHPTRPGHEFIADAILRQVPLDTAP